MQIVSDDRVLGPKKHFVVLGSMLFEMEAEQLGEASVYAKVVSVDSDSELSGFVGVSKLNEGDTFNRDVGLKLAIMRAVKSFMDSQVSMAVSVGRNVKSKEYAFKNLSRCMQRKINGIKAGLK